MDPTALGIVTLFLVSFIAVLITLDRNEDIEQIFKNFATASNLYFQPRPNSNKTQYITGKYGGNQIAVGTDVIASETSGPALIFLYVEIKFSNSSPELKISRLNFINRHVFKKNVASEVGFSDLNEKFVFENSSVDMIGTLFASSTLRRQLVEVNPLLIQITEHGVYSEASMDDFNTDTLRNVLGLATAIANRIKQLERVG